MNIGFKIRYRTVWGEFVAVRITWRTKTGKENNIELALSTADGVWWSGDIAAPANAVEVSYEYRIRRDSEVVRREWHMLPRTLQLQQGRNRIATCDRWRDNPTEQYLYTSAFTENFRRHAPQPWPTIDGQKALLIRVFAPEVPQEHTLAILGSHPTLGEWQHGREIRLVPIGPNEWAVAINLEQLQGTVEYKYLTIDNKTGQCTWELHDNRQFTRPNIEQRMSIVMEDEPVRLPFAPWRGAGCVIPVFSLRSEHSFGVGDFGDLRRMINWISITGQHALQILPINDTTMTGQWTDSYPYNAISIYALHPLYADLSALPLKDAAQRAMFEEIQKELNALAHLDYERVIESKRKYLRLLFRQEWNSVNKTKEYKQFFAQNEEWLIPYAAYCYLRDRLGTPDYRQWGRMSTYKASEIKKLTKKGTESADEMELNYYIQFILHQQLCEVQRYAREKCVMLKGDIPIGISANSVEAWTEPHYFNLNGQAGAPPDYFSQNGQNWGFPTYNWEAMLADGCRWWRRRFEKMSEYFDAYRIDHVLGFFRIWEIPRHSVHGLLGHFSPALPMSIDEIEGFGLPWREDIYTRPYITDRILNRVFGDLTSDVRRLYLDSIGNGHYAMKHEFDTQRKVEAYFADKLDLKSKTICDGLYRLISNVLFLRDEQKTDHFHPRIVAMHDFLYEDLGDWEKDAFNRIHEHYFHQRHNQFWYEESMKKLPTLVAATRMLVCAEDLGMIPQCVPWVMDELGILTLEIQTMPKKGWVQFANLWENPYRSVATISTHDMPTMRQWWDEQRETAQQYYNQILFHEGQTHHPMSGAVAEEIVSRHLECPSMLCMLSLQDWLAIDEQVRNPNIADERINVPANPRHYWRWRMHLTIEKLINNTALNEKIRGLVKSHGR